MTHSSLLPDRFDPVLNQPESADEFVIAEVERKQFDVVRERCGSDQHIGYGGAMAEAVAMKQFRKAERNDSINGNHRNGGQLFHGVIKRKFVALTRLYLCNCYRRNCDVVKAKAQKLLHYFRSVEKKLDHDIGIAENRHRHAIFRISLREIFLPFHKPASSRNSFSDLNVPLGISFRNGFGFRVADFFFFVFNPLAVFIRNFFSKVQTFRVFKTRNLLSAIQLQSHALVELNLNPIL